MRQFLFTTSVLVSFLRSGISSLVTFLGPSWDGPARKYRPEDHYMRGPGPKWREKHFLDRASAGRHVSSPSNRSSESRAITAYSLFRSD